jgi:WD40 repeat protein
LLSIEAETICLPSGLKFALKTLAVCPTKVCRQLPAKSQSLRLLSIEAEIILQTGHAAGVSSVNFSPDGKQIVSASGDNNLKLWDLAGNCLQTFVGHTAEVWSANKFTLQTSAVCPTKVCRQLPAKSQSLRLLSIEAETICLPSGLKFTLQTSAVDGKQIVSASIDNNLKLWDLAGNCLRTFVGHTAMVSSANFSPDGKQIVSASMDNNLKL